MYYSREWPPFGQRLGKSAQASGKTDWQLFRTSEAHANKPQMGGRNGCVRQRVYEKETKDWPTSKDKNSQTGNASSGAKANGNDGE